MGGFLDKPVTDKISSDFENELLKCGASSMQGWRVTQEDAHNCILDYDTDSSLFAVYDGHGGHEVAEYASQNLPDFIKNLETYKNGAFDKALIEAFLGFDAELTTEAIINKLKVIAGLRSNKSGKEGGDSSDEDIDEDVDVKTLKKEAKMPLTELIAKYAATHDLKKKLAAALEKDQNSEVTSSSTTGNLSATSEEDSKINGSCETERNGGVDSSEVGCSSSNDDAVSSSSHVNGDVNGGNCSKAESSVDPSEGCSTADSNSIRPSKRKAVISMYRSLRDDSYESDSDDNDESFPGGDANQSSDDEGEEKSSENGKPEVVENNNAESKSEAEEKVEAEEQEEEDEEDDEDEDDDDEDDDDEDEDDDEEEMDAEAIRELRRKEEPGSDSGCTAVVCLVQKETLYVANAGDSRAVLCRGGKAIDLSIDHKPKSKGERKRIEAAGGKVSWEGRVNDGLNLSRALGDHVYKQNTDLDATQQMITALPDVRIEKLDPLQDEFIILACDGIWNSMSSQQAVDFVRPLINKEEKLSKICEKMFDKCLAPENYMFSDGSGTDNMTCVIVQFNRNKQDLTSKRQSDSPLKEEISVKKVKIDNTSEE